MAAGTEIIAGTAAALIAALLTATLCVLAIRMRIGLNAVTERSNHHVPTPRTGGLMILLGLLAASLILAFCGLLTSVDAKLLALTFAAGAAGLADDFFELPALVKLTAQLAVALVGAVLIGTVEVLPVPGIGWVDLARPVALSLTVLWIAGVMNTVNFMDGLNGLIGSFAVLGLSAAMFLLGAITWPLVAAQLAILAFLVCNAVRGRIFLGDAGSLSLGFLIAAAPLLSASPERFWLMPLVVLPLGADVALTLFRRAKRGERLSEAHREHVYQRLKAAGLSHQAVSSGVLAAVGTACLLAFSISDLLLMWPLAFAGAAAMVIAAWAGVMALLGKAAETP